MIGSIRDVYRTLNNASTVKPFVLPLKLWRIITSEKGGKSGARGRWRGARSVHTERAAVLADAAGLGSAPFAVEGTAPGRPANVTVLVFGTAGLQVGVASAVEAGVPAAAGGRPGPWPRGQVTRTS